MSNNPHRDPWHKDSWPEVAAELQELVDEQKAELDRLRADVAEFQRLVVGMLPAAEAYIRRGRAGTEFYDFVRKARAILAKRQEGK